MSLHNHNFADAGGRKKKSKKEELGMSWKETAQLIAEDAWEQFKDNEEAAIEFIEESVDGCAEVIYTAKAYDVVCSAASCDYETFEIADNELRDTGGDRIYDGETVDDIITRLAYWIIHTEAMDHYWKLVKEHEEKEEDNEEAIYDA